MTGIVLTKNIIGFFEFLPESYRDVLPSVSKGRRSSDFMTGSRIQPGNRKSGTYFCYRFSQQDLLINSRWHIENVTDVIQKLFVLVQIVFLEDELEGSDFVAVRKNEYYSAVVLARFNESIVVEFVLFVCFREFPLRFFLVFKNVPGKCGKSFVKQKRVVPGTDPPQIFKNFSLPQATYDLYSSSS